MSNTDDITMWRAALEEMIVESLPNGLVDRVVVLESVESTQDECDARSDGQPGLCVAALTQVAGRGRLGRVWIDERGEGVAMSVGVHRQSPQRLSIASGLAVCLAVERLGLESARIRWPNDVMVEGRKLAGVLVEVRGDVAIVGIGVNVLQRDWPTDIATVAMSLRQVGITSTRLDVARELLVRLDAALEWSDDTLASAFRSRDVMRGSVCTFRHGQQCVTGRVMDVDPMFELVVEQPDGAVITLSAQSTSLISIDQARGLE